MKLHSRLSISFGALLLLGSLFAAEPAAPVSREPKPSKTEVATGSKSEQLAAAQKELATMRLRHDDRHPALLKQRAKVARLQKEVRDEQKLNAKAEPAEQLAAAKRDLDKLLEKYTEEHPAVKATKKRIAELEKARK